ncbi:hypothetical protein AXG93_1920s1000 [Marchantia polymorpha subsp. ruderalis]|uniref:Uncharacterized protein n=1 Tax=Marchantia polymorpha subsp. ruderalis TaxID=1480154 RepID=A0A176WET0_MARPO|nr:hypothetical protein AXG93_1920s1000 [Marchantia polymorpha subsp. ruderalis]
MPEASSAAQPFALEPPAFHISIIPFHFAVSGIAKRHSLLLIISRCLAAEALLVHAVLPASVALATALRAPTRDATVETS